MDVAALLARCTFPPAGTAIDCACSGGADSTALVLLAVAARCDVTVHHVDHGLRPSSADDARAVRLLAEGLGLPVVVHPVTVGAGPNLEARARDARLGALPAGTLTGHTADDQAETLLVRLLRGNAAGLAAMRPGPTRPLLSLRRAETHAVCAGHGITPVEDASNADPAHVRNRVRHEVLPLLDDVARRDVVPLLVRIADLVRDDDDLLVALADVLDPSDARALADAPAALARRAVRRWLTDDGYPPDLAAVERVLDVARGHHVACEIVGGRRVERRDQRLRVPPPGR